jgi:hypothetical protein
MVIVKYNPAREREPSIYITRTDRVHLVDGRSMWTMDYTVDGVLQGAMFDSPDAMAEYREYLDTLGRVYQKEPSDER